MARTFTVKNPGGRLPTGSALSAKRRRPGHGHGRTQAELVAAYKKRGPRSPSRLWTSRLGALFAVVNYALVHGGTLPVLEEHMSIPASVALTATTATTPTPTTSSQRSRTDTPTCSNTGTCVHSDEPATTMDMRSRTRDIQCTKTGLTPDVDTDTDTVSSNSSTSIQSGRVLRPRKFDRNYKV